MTVKEQVAKQLKPMFEYAEEHNLWFFHQGLSGLLWFSPQELREKQKDGQFIWGEDNWQLEDPFEELENLREAVIEKQEKYVNFATRIDKAVFETTGLKVRHAKYLPRIGN